MSKTKMKLLAPVAAVTMLSAALYGCQNASPAGGDAAKPSASKADEPSASAAKQAGPINASIFLMDSAAKPDSFVTTKIIKDKFNINMDWQINPYDGYFDKLNVMVASNSLPDLIAPIPIDQAKDLGGKGALVPLDQYMDKMPNLKKYFDKDKISYASSMASDGHIYAVPAFDQKVNFRYVPTLRKDLLDETGLPSPQTFDDLEKVLLAIKAKHPDSLGIVSKEKGDALNDFGTNFNTRTEMFYDETQDKYTYGPANKGYKDMITYLNRLWSEKLLDPEFFTASDKQWEDKVMSGKAAFWLSWPEFSYKYVKQYKDLHPDSGFSTVPTDPLTAPSYGKKVVQGMPQTNTWTTIAISSQSKNIDRLVQLIDWMYSDEGSTALQFGIEGQTYNVENNQKKFAPDIKAAYNNSGTKEQSDLGIGPGGNLLIRVIRSDEFQFIPDYQKPVEDKVDQYRKSNYYALANKGMSLTFTQQQLDDKNQTEADLKTFVQENSIKFITGQKPLSDYDAFVGDLKKRGADKVEAIYADAYAKFKDSMGKVK